MPAISVTKKICHIPNPIFAKDARTQAEAIDLIKIEGTPLVAEEEIEFSEDDLPQYLIAGKCSFLPSPKPEGYHFRKKNYLLDKLLLEREMAQGINSEKDGRY